MKLLQGRSQFAFALATSLLAACISGSMIIEAEAQDYQSRKSFTADLAKTLLGANSIFVELPADQGWQGIVLAPPGTSLAPIIEAYNGYPGELSQTLANSAVFDRPIKSVQGLAVFEPRTLDVVWNNVLTMTRPGVPLPRDRMLTLAVMKWLFKPIYKKNKVVGYTREPSRYVHRYREFESLYTMLQRGRQNDMWKLDRRLSKYASFDEAQKAVVREWLKSGYKAEVETAIWSFESSATGSQWRNWASVNEQFEAHRRPIDFYTKLPETFLLPPPASWSSVSSWLRAVSKSASSGEYRFQLSRIKVERPWLDLNALLRGDIKLPAISNGQTNVLSDGVVPAFDRFPNGDLPAFVTELIIIRDIKFIGSPELVDSSHPLALFAYPDAINLVGYVVRVLPQMPRKVTDTMDAELVTQPQ